jgi:Domain of unknown function (DUF2017)
VKVTGRHGRLRLRLDPVEVDVLGQLLDELSEVLNGTSEGDDGVLERLYPAAYPDDDEAAVEFRTLTESSLTAERTERIALCRAELVASSDIDLGDPDAGRRWIQVLNDLRLTHGTRLGITEDDDPDIDPTDPGQRSRLLYYWLTAVQDSVVQALMR